MVYTKGTYRCTASSIHCLDGEMDNLDFPSPPEVYRITPFDLFRYSVFSDANGRQLVLKAGSKQIQIDAGTKTPSLATYLFINGWAVCY